MYSQDGINKMCATIAAHQATRTPEAQRQEVANAWRRRIKERTQQLEPSLNEKGLAGLVHRLTRGGEARVHVSCALDAQVDCYTAEDRPNGQPRSLKTPEDLRLPILVEFIRVCREELKLIVEVHIQSPIRGDLEAFEGLGTPWLTLRLPPPA